MATPGPTQGAERHAATIERWKSRPWLARILRVAIAVAPLAASIGFTLGVGRLLPPERLGMPRLVWIATVFVAANLLLFVLARLTRRLLPLVALMKLTLVFPDNAPSRTRSALRRSNSRTMLREMEEARARGELRGETVHGDYLVQLLKEVNDHDRLTRGHSERVRAYSELLGEEIGLDADDMDKLRWAALLHDVGKLTVPSAILNKDGRPTDEEWKILSGHPGAGLPMLEPLRPWLGDWIHAADEHHCRWDGNGYPKKVGGTDITLAGRIVAIADAYDVMTSARSYKKPLPPELARQELTDCAGAQFDPTLVRAFLRIGLHRLKTVSGPMAWIANLTGSAQIPVPATTAVTNVAVSSGTAAVAMATAALGGFLPAAPPPPPLDLAFVEQAVVADEADAAIDVAPPTPSPAAPPATPAPLRTTPSPTPEPEATPSPLPTPIPTPQPPTTPTPTPPPIVDLEALLADDAVSVPEDTSLLIDVLDNDRDPENRSVELFSVSSPDHGEAVVVGSRIRYTPPLDFHGTDRFTYRAGDGTTPTQVARVVVSVTPVNDPPVATVQNRSIPENSPPGTVVAEVQASDVDGTTPTVTITGGDPSGRFTIATDGTVTVADGAVLDHETERSHLLRYRVDDGADPIIVSATVTIADVDEAPIAVADSASTTEDTPVAIAVGANDADPEGSALTWDVPARSTAGAELAVVDGVVTYAPVADWSGLDTFATEAIDASGQRSAPATVTVTVTPVNDPPVAVDDGGIGFATLEDTVLVTPDVTENDSDVDGEVDAAAVVLVSDAAHGTAVHNGDGTFTYTPDRDYAGGDTFTYRVVDAAGAASSPATVTVGIAAVNDAPVAGDDALAVTRGSSATTIDVRLDDDDADGDPLEVVSVTDGTHGTAVHNGDGTITYTHDGSASVADVVVYTVEDPDGAQDSATIQITIDGIEDYDAVAAAQDNCPTTFNPDQFDTDGDGVGDACDPSPTDSSGGNFSDSFARMGDDDTYGLAAGDVDGDGRVDVVFANHGANTVWRDGGLYLADTGQELGSAPSEGAVLVDIDGDGDRDLAVANGDGAANTIWINDGDGDFADSGQRLGDDHSRDVATADVDGDGDADLVVANAQEPSAIWLNDGTGQFSEGVQSLGGGGAEAVAVGDVDGDGDPDLAFAVDGADNEVWLNDGSGTYVDSGQALGQGRGHDVALGDLDGDGDLDLVFANDNDGDHVWLNDGTGVFTKTGQTLGLGHSRAVMVGDLDGDGDIDIALGDHTGPNSVWWNNGSGVFADSGERLGSQSTEGLVLVDVDGDGDYGIITAEVGSSNRMYANF